MSSHSDPLQNLAAMLRAHVEMLAGRIGERHVSRPAALHAAADYIRKQWQDQGHRLSIQSYRVGNLDCHNLEVTVPGNARAGQILLVGAHYDTVPGSPGADDNASGIAALLEIGRALATANPRRTIRLAAFVNEEPPFFYGDQMGSMIYARAARQRGDDIVLMMSLEMLGYYDGRAGSQAYPPLLSFFFPDRGDFIAFVSNLASRRQLAEAVQAFKANSDFPVESLATLWFVPGVAWSDQLSFWRQDYPALMVTDTAFYRNRHYHSPHDTPEKLDYASMARVVDGLGRAILTLAER